MTSSPDAAEKVVAELLEAAPKLERALRVEPPLTLDESNLMRRAAALIESQRATIESTRTAYEQMNDAFIEANDLIAAAEARVTALEAEKAGVIKLADGYGIVLMMIAAGCSDPQRFAKRMLAEYEAEAKKMEATK